MSPFAHVAVRRRRIFSVGPRGRARSLTSVGRFFRACGTVSRKKAWAALLPIGGPGFWGFPDGEGGRKRKGLYLPFSSGRGEPFLSAPLPPPVFCPRRPEAAPKFITRTQHNRHAWKGIVKDASGVDFFLVVALVGWL